jgi:hypothetical protein
MVGENVDGNKFDLSKLEGGIINVRDFPIDSETGTMGQVYGDQFGNPNRLPIDAEAATLKKNNMINVTTSTLGGRSQFKTVEHAQSVLGIHEYYGHGVKNASQEFPSHGKAYQYEYNHKRTFNKLSQHQQNRIILNKDRKS